MRPPGNVPDERFQLSRRKSSAKWQMRFSIRGQGQLKRPFDTDDLREAQRRAEAIWYEAIYRAQQGLTARAHTFERGRGVHRADPIMDGTGALVESR